MAKINNFLIPNVNALDSNKNSVEQSNKLSKGEKSEFKGLVDKFSQADLRQPQVQPGDLGPQINFSTHATKRLQERNIELDGNEYMKLKEAISKLRHKGGHDSLVITQKAAYVIDVGKSTVVTAVDKNNMNENVFTKIDSTIFMM
ncbi:MAG TPA: TIGR02530 family flagellar biosynthesis protein [Bacteriovoracaceae bacterium]|nr:TIGR02530 family flagellar biosynthesis protein [Bacteriovoracaceae bacterium]